MLSLGIIEVRNPSLMRYSYFLPCQAQLLSTLVQCVMLVRKVSPGDDDHDDTATDAGQVQDDIEDMLDSLKSRIIASDLDDFELVCIRTCY